MAITASAGNRKLVPTGNYFASVVGVYDIGTQPSDKYGPSHQIIVSFELHKKKGVCLNDDGKPMIYNKYFGLGLGINRATKKPSILRQCLEAILNRGLNAEETKGYDVALMAGKSVRLTIVHDEEGRDQISGFAPMDEDDPAINAESTEVVYELAPGQPIPAFIPEWIQKTIQKSTEFSVRQKQVAAAVLADDDIPF